MKTPSQVRRSSVRSGASRWFASLVAVVLVGIGMFRPPGIKAQVAPSHLLSTPQLTAFVEGIADYDGDGRTGSAEDTDGDKVFSSISAIPGFDQPSGIIGPRNTYNHIVIVTSGDFHESIRRSSGDTMDYTIEAAPGVVAIFDIGDLAPELNASPLTVSSSVTLRNLTFRNYGDIIRVAAGGTLLAEGCRFEDSGGGFAIVVAPNARAVVSNSTITRCGDRQTGQGGGIRVVPGADVIVSNCTITGNFGAGVVRRDKRLRLLNTLVAHNNPNFLD